MTMNSLNTRAQTATVLDPESLLPSAFEVTIIKPGIANGLTYPAHVLQAGAPKFAGVSMFANHPTALDFTRAGGRNVEELAGVIEEAYWSNYAVQGRARKFGPKADLLAALAQQIIHDRESGLPVPDIGLSADMLVSQERGTVVAINKVLAVDIVFSPATGGAFERVLNAVQLPEGRYPHLSPEGRILVDLGLQNLRLLEQLMGIVECLHEHSVVLASSPQWAIGHVHHDWALDPDSPWSFEASDGNAIIEKGGWALYKAAHLLCDVSQVVDRERGERGDVPEAKEAYKLPVAKLVDGRMTYFWHAVSAAYAALKGARGGLSDVPATVIAEVINGPIKALYRAFDKEFEE